MIKSHNSIELSSKVCVLCGKRLKRRLTENKDAHNIRKCYNCYAAVRYANLSWSDSHNRMVNKCAVSHKDAVRL